MRVIVSISLLLIFKLIFGTLKGLKGGSVGCFIEISTSIDNFVKFFASFAGGSIGEEKVFEGDWSFEGANDVDLSIASAADPFSEFEIIWSGCGEHDYSDVRGQHDDDFFPNDTAVLVVYVVHLVKDDEFNV